MTENLFSSRAATMRDEELIRIAHSTDTDSYEPDAIQASHAELARRGISNERMSELREENEFDKQYEESKADRPLPWFLRIVFFLFAPMLLLWAATVLFSARGYNRMFREAWRVQRVIATRPAIYRRVFRSPRFSSGAD